MKKGFTLVELMVSMVILVALMGGFMTTYNGLLKAAQQTRDSSFAYSTAFSKLEEIMEHDFNLLKKDYSPGGTPGPTFTITDLTGNVLEGIGNITIIDKQALYGGGETEVKANAGWTARHNHTSVVHNGKIFVIGGDDSDAGYKNDVWSSADGDTWIEDQPSAGWTGREDHSSLVYLNKIWVMGGQITGEAHVNDVWSSDNGVTWVEVKDSAAWSEREDFTALVYANKMWVMGGQEGGGAKMNDVWWSSNGADWFLATGTADWSKRFNHSSVTFDNKIWVIGGEDSGGVKNDIWYSSDGITWTEANSSAAWAARVKQTTVVHEGKMWLMGGENGGDYNDVWSSAGYDRLLEVILTVSWKQRDGRIIGEDLNLNGILDAGEDANSNGRLDSPSELRSLISETRGRRFMGR